MEKEKAKILMELARESIKKGIEGKMPEPENIDVDENIKKEFDYKRGVFTTLYLYPEKKLRGCIGIPYPIYPLWKAVIISAYESAFCDPRFNPLKKDEFQKIVIEITVLTEPEKLEGEPEDYIHQIEIGKHGLIAQRGIFKGLLLPQVATEWGFNEEEFLSETCLKAGLEKDSWKDKNTIIYRFSGILIKESKPFGDIEVNDLTKI